MIDRKILQERKKGPHVIRISESRKSGVDLIHVELIDPKNPRKFGDRVLGHCTLGVRGKVLRLNDIDVSPQARKQGQSIELLKAVEGFARQRGINRIDVRVVMPEARPFWENLARKGFLQVVGGAGVKRIERSNLSDFEKEEEIQAVKKKLSERLDGAEFFKPTTNKAVARAKRTGQLRQFKYWKPRKARKP